MHFANISPRCFRKHSELDEKYHVYKGITILRGDSIRDEDNNAAVFQDMASSASLMAASRLVDFIGSHEGFKCEQSDAPSAYTQAELGGDAETWVTLPKTGSRTTGRTSKSQYVV